MAVALRSKTAERQNDLEERQWSRLVTRIDLRNLTDSMGTVRDFMKRFRKMMQMLVFDFQHVPMTLQDAIQHWTTKEVRTRLRETMITCFARS
jgi:hypothetical protein